MDEQLQQWKEIVERRLYALEARGNVDDIHRANIVQRLEGIEDTLKWLTRLILGALVTGIFAIGFAILTSGA